MNTAKNSTERWVFVFYLFLGYGRYFYNKSIIRHIVITYSFATNFSNLAFLPSSSTQIEPS